MKKLLSVFLAILLMSALIPCTYAVKLDEGYDALRAQWSRGEGPMALGYSIDYSYYQPEEKENVTYPLFVFMAGATEGLYEGKELLANEFCNWSSEELQAQVADSGGAYLLILRAPEPVLFDTLPPAASMAAINDFVNSHPDIDTSRIYAAGWCIGAAGVKNLAVSYPGYFAGICLISSRCSISATEAQSLSETAVWFFGCTGDSYALYSVYTEPSWYNIRTYASDRTKIRLTKATAAPDESVLFNHNMWQLLEEDFSAASQSLYSGLTTVDGNNTEAENVKVISWLTSIYNYYGTSDTSGNNSVTGFVYSRIIALIKTIFAAIRKLTDFSGYIPFIG